MPDFIPTPVKILFTINEVKSAVRKLKSSQSPGKDEISAPDIVYEQIAKIYNNIAGTGEHSNEITDGIVRSLQKPGKHKGLSSNFRPVILLSILRKILTFCIMRRIGDRLDAEVPPPQAAYRKCRSTTEHVFATKMVLERTISAIRNILDHDELHLIKIVLDVKLSIKCACKTSEYLSTDTGAPQGNCASSNDFTYYLAKSIASIRKSTTTGHSYTLQEICTTIPDELTEHSYATITQISYIILDMEYANHVSKL